MGYELKGGKLSQLEIDADLLMGAHSITLDAGQTVDGVNLSHYDLSGTGSIIEPYIDCADKVLDTVATPDATSLTTFQDVGTPYTIAKANMDDKSAGIKVTIACELKTEIDSYRAYAAYNIDGGADQAIGDNVSEAWVSESVALVVASEGQVIQFRAKNGQNGVSADIKNMVITQTHAAKKDQRILGYY